ncbi:glycoside hydrolase family 5 protein [Wolfiporia cocos MD-104 SS10]|uniref:glucan 1,3-beta-glucosidase n=1 Tax=Wolfiporia cocos (strain MD-104) TaxID=742152 RepID=A0A2H3J0M8_WOLCO|nr:glycoside hydrolase family 5 protein [Wolfiporia cocos MD-104 SS10]
MSAEEHETPGLAPPQNPFAEPRPASEFGRADSQPNMGTPYVPQEHAYPLPDASIPSTPRDPSLATPGVLADGTQPSAASSDGLKNATPLVSAEAAAAPPASKEAANIGSDEALMERDARGAGKRPWYKRPVFWLAAFAALAVVVLVVVLPVWFVGVKPHRDHNSSASASNTNPESPTGATSGGNGSTIVTEDGTKFTYVNNFGGHWVYDPRDPFNNSARPNLWTPPLSEPWNWSTNRIFGVNLGGLFEIEPFISPSLFQANPGSEDEWTLDTSLRARSNITEVMEEHYATFVTEQDIAEIAGAGLNWIRLPIPFWAIDVWDDVGVYANGTTVAEPFLARTCWPYILRILGWARKYGIRINLDLHTIPGSQNGYNHSGKMGMVNFLNGVMGVANAERALEYIRVIAEFISQSEYQPVVPIFSIVNEPLLTTIGKDTLTTFYLRAHDMIRNITGIGEGHGPYIAIHDGFEGVASWAGFLQGSDRIALDTHPYFAFDNQPNTEPANVTATGSNNSSVYGGQWPKMACQSWGASMNVSRVDFGVTIAGEFSSAINDCGLWVRAVNVSADYGGDCEYWMDYTMWSDETKAGLKEFVMASMDALGDWFFWTWKIGNSSTTNSVQAPLWSYKLGLEHGWVPADPRSASGTCESLGVDPQPWNESYASWATGGAGAGTVVASSVSQYDVWPPSSIANVPAASQSYLPQYTSTASVVSLPPAATYTVATVSTGNGWYDASDTASAPTAIKGCTYPDAWSAVGSAVPTAGCGAAANAKRELHVAPPRVTEPPRRK